MLVNDRHILRYLKKDTCFEPKKGWNEEIINREEREFNNFIYIYVCIYIQTHTHTHTHIYIESKQ